MGGAGGVMAGSGSITLAISASVQRCRASATVAWRTMVASGSLSCSGARKLRTSSPSCRTSSGCPSMSSDSRSASVVNFTVSPTARMWIGVHRAVNQPLAMQVAQRGERCFQHAARLRLTERPLFQRYG